MSAEIRVITVFFLVLQRTALKERQPKATAGSCAMEICVLSFLILMPIIMGLAALYFLIPYIYSSKEEGSRSLQPICEKSRVLGIVGKVYPDSEQYKFLCTGLNFGDNLGVTLTECFDRGKPTPAIHYVTSRSPYWSKDNTLHSIINSNAAKINGKSITIFEVDPSLPEPCASDDYDDLIGDDSYFYVEQAFQPESDHVLVGWQYDSRQAIAPFREIPVTDRCQPNFPSAIVFTSNGRYFTGFQSVYCTEIDSFEDSLIPYSIFLKQIHDLYPNVEFKNNAPSKVFNIRNVNYNNQARPKTDLIVPTVIPTIVTGEYTKLFSTFRTIPEVVMEEDLESVGGLNDLFNNLHDNETRVQRAFINRDNLDVDIKQKLTTRTDKDIPYDDTFEVPESSDDYISDLPEDQNS